MAFGPKERHAPMMARAWRGSRLARESMQFHRVLPGYRPLMRRRACEAYKDQPPALQCSSHRSSVNHGELERVCYK
jgi:hypothetical protein